MKCLQKLVSFNYSFLLFSYIKTEETLLDQRRRVAWKASFTHFFLLFYTQNLLELLTFWYSLPMDLNASKLMCKMLAENDFHRTEWPCIFGQEKGKAADTLIANYNEPFDDPLNPSEELKQNKIRAVKSSNSFVCRPQVEIKAKLELFSKQQKKCDFCSCLFSFFLILPWRTILSTDNNFHLCSSHLSSNL